jgi:hypothetical protein
MFDIFTEQKEPKLYIADITIKYALKGKKVFVKGRAIDLFSFNLILSKLFDTLTDTNKLHIDDLIVNNEFINYQNSRIRLKYSPGYMKMCEY